jgi:hypothetical protein
MDSESARALKMEQSMVRELLRGLPHAMLLEARDKLPKRRLVHLTCRRLSHLQFHTFNQPTHFLTRMFHIFSNQSVAGGVGYDDKQLVVLVPSVAWATKDLSVSGISGGVNGNNSRATVGKLKLVRSSDVAEAEGAEPAGSGAQTSQASKDTSKEEFWGGDFEGVSMNQSDNGSQHDRTTTNYTGSDGMGLVKYHLFPVHPSRRFLVPCPNPSNSSSDSTPSEMAKARPDACGGNRSKPTTDTAKNGGRGSSGGSSVRSGSHGGSSSDGVAGAMLLLLFRWLARQHTRVMALAPSIASDTGG